MTKVHDERQSGEVLTKVYDFMRRGVIYCYPEDTAKQAAEMMLANKIRSLAVVDEEGELWGSVSRFDILRHYGEDLAKIKVKDVLRPYKWDVDPQWPIEKAVDLMRKEKTEYLLITEPYTPTKRLVGILTNFDIVRYMAGVASGHFEHLFRALG